MNVRTEQTIAVSVLFFCTVLVVLPVVIILGIIVAKGASAISFEFLFEMPRNGMTAGGIFPAILGTFYLVLGAVLFAVPLGVLSAIYLVEYSRESRVSRLIKLAIVNLAGVPSVVYGLFGLGVFVVFLGFGASILSGSLTLGIMILPVIITASREALESVPRSFRVVSLSLGASKWQTIRYSVLPHAIPGILTGT
ncbi:MAG: phosphate ABC transporter permease PstA, partial [Bacteroidota bacterium]